jgi:tetratricopeptide (TPR) repeat protein
MKNIDSQEIIKKYVDGAMDAVEKQAFEQDLATDAALQKEVEVYRQIYFVLHNKNLLSVSQTIGAVMDKTPLTPDFDAYQNYFDTPSVKTGKTGHWLTNKGLWLLGVLALVLATGVGVYTFKNTAEQARNVAIISQFEPFSNIVGLNADDRSPFAQAMRLYDSSDFSEAKTLLTSYVKRTNDPMAQLYLGISQLMTDDNEAAIKTLRSVVENSDAFTQEPARYNLALALLKVGKRQEATNILRGLVEHPIYGEKARAVVDELNKN